MTLLVPAPGAVEGRRLLGRGHALFLLGITDF